MVARIIKQIKINLHDWRQWIGCILVYAGGVVLGQASGLFSLFVLYGVVLLTFGFHFVEAYGEQRASEAKEAFKVKIYKNGQGNTEVSIDGVAEHNIDIDLALDEDQQPKITKLDNLH